MVTESLTILPDRVATLSRRQKECLRLVYGRRTSKEIARDLGIEKSTVDGYLAEAVRQLGARDRRDAAELLATYEAMPPDEIGGDPARVADRPADPSQPDQQRDEAADTPSFPLPFRRKGQAGNDLTPGQRILMILVLAVGMALAFQLLANGVALINGAVSFASGRSSPPSR